MTELPEVLKTIEKLDRTLTLARQVLNDAKQVPADGELKLPSPESIRDFYSDYVLFKTAEMNSTKDILTIRTHTQKLEISMIGVLELLSDKLNVPVVRTPEQKITSKPPFVTDMDAIIAHKMDWIKAEFNKIMAVDDPRINRMCQSYYDVQSYPLIVRLNYLQWEREFISYHMKQAEIKLEDKKTLELREVRKQYTERLDKEKSGLNLRISQMQNEHRRLRTVNDRLDGFYQNASTENIGLKHEIEALHDKKKGNEDSMTRFSEENSALKAEVEILRNKLNKYEAAEWKQDFASTNASPVFYNLKDNKIIKFPCSLDEFKKVYSLKSSDGTNRTYSSQDGKDFIIPDSLALKLPSLIQSQQPTGENGKDKQNMIHMNGKDIKVTEGVKAVYEFLKNNDEPASTREIMEETGIAQSTIGARHLKTLKELGILEEEDAGGMKKYLIINSEDD